MRGFASGRLFMLQRGTADKGYGGRTPRTYVSCSMHRGPPKLIGMGMLAAGAYLRSLRKARGLSRVAVVTTIGTDTKTLWSWETGSVQPLALSVARLTAVVAGDARHVQALLLDDSATVPDGERLAALQLELEERGL